MPLEEKDISSAVGCCVLRLELYTTLIFNACVIGAEKTEALIKVAVSSARVVERVMVVGARVNT